MLGCKGVEAPFDRRVPGSRSSSPEQAGALTEGCDLERDSPTPFLIFVPTEVTPQNGTTKALDICVRRKLPGLETLFSPSLLRVQKLKSEFSPV